MKKLSLFLSFICLSLLVYGQDVSTINKGKSNFLRSEIRVNLLNSVLGLPEVDYEYFIQDNFGLGVFAMAGLDKETFNINYGILPYGRLYFGNKPASGFFIEGNTGIISQEVTIYNSNYNNGYIYSTSSRTKNQIGLGLGVAVGFKFLTKNDWVGDMFLGIGRVFGKDTNEGYPRVGISIGKRF